MRTHNTVPRGHTARRRSHDDTIAFRHRRAPSRWCSTGIPLLKGAAIALVVVLVSGLSVSAIGAWRFSNELSNNALDISNGEEMNDHDIASFSGGFNVLLVGVDNSPDQSSQFGERQATLNDVTMLLHVAADHQHAVVVSFPRDLVIPQPECVIPESGKVSSSVSHQPINTAFGRGGLGCVVATVQKLTGLQIPFAGLITFRGAVAMADAVGGVPICVKSPLFDPYSGLDLPAGISTISGERALSFLRSRHGVGDESDLSRISSQQAYLSSLLRVMKKSATLANIPQLIELAKAVTANVKLSRSLASVSTMVGMAASLNDISLEKMAFVQYPTATDPDDINRVIPSVQLAKRLLAKIKADQPVTLDPVSPEDAAGLNSPSPPPASRNTQSRDATSGPTLSPDPAVIGRLRGQTADEHICSSTDASHE